MSKGYLVLDVENNNSKVYRCKAGCFLVDPIVAFALKNEKELKSTYIYPEKLQNLQIDEDVLVIHNATHDLPFLWHLKGIQEFFLRGGKLWDTMKAEYLLSGHLKTYKELGLRDLAVNKYGCKQREKVMEPYWDQGWDTSDIPKELVMQDVENDVLDTEKIYLAQLIETEKLGMTKAIEYQMDGVLAKIEMKVNGMKIHKETLEKNKLKLEKELEDLYKRLGVISEKYWR